MNQEQYMYRISPEPARSSMALILKDASRVAGPRGILKISAAAESIRVNPRYPTAPVITCLS